MPASTGSLVNVGEWSEKVGGVRRGALNADRLVPSVRTVEQLT